MAKSRVTLEVAGREVSVSSPDKPYFPTAGHTKLDVIEYYLAVAEGALRGIAGRPLVMKRFVNGAEADFFFQKRVPAKRPEWIDTVELKYPSGRSAVEVVVRDAAQLVWLVNLGCIDLNPHQIRADDLEHPDELRIDLDPVPGVDWAQIRDVAMVAREVLVDVGLVGFPKTSGSRGMHINVRLERKWAFADVRRASQAIAREVERRAPDIATAKWWKEERHGVFLDFNQNAKDRTVASAYSVRPTKDARVSAPLTWDEVPTCEAEAFTLTTMPERFRELGDVGAAIDDHAGDLSAVLLMATEQDASLPPEPKQKDGSGRRVSKKPLIEIGRAAKKDDAIAGLERWKAKHPEVATHLEAADVLVDSMRGRYTTWTRIRVNLEHVPEPLRPDQAPPDPDYNPWRQP